MADVNVSEGRTRFVWGTDKIGNEFVCAIDSLKDSKRATEEELKNCIDEAKSIQPFADG